MSVTITLETGYLDELIRGTEGPAIRRYVCDGVPYGVFQEFGFEHWRSGKRVAAHPFMKPAAEALRDDFKYALENTLVFATGANIWQRVEDVVAETAFRLMFIARDLAPVDTGALMGSINVQRDEPL